MAPEPTVMQTPTGPMASRPIARRDVLRLVGLGTLASLAAACGQPLAPAAGKPVAEKPAATPVAAAPVAATQAPAAPAAAPTAASTAAQPTTAPAAGGKVVEAELGSLAAFAAPGHPAVKLVDAFNARHTDMKVTIRNYGAAYEDVMQKAQANIAAKLTPALVTTGWKYAKFADAALNIVDLHEVGGAETDQVLGRYPSWVVDIVRVNDKIAGLPFALSTPILYYNKSLFEKAGLDPEKPPVTWAEAATFAGALKQKAGVQAPIIGGLSEWTVQSFIQNNGGRVLDDRGKAVFESAEAIGGMKVWTDLREAGHFVVVEAAQQQPTFTAGNAGMHFISVASIASFRAGATFPMGTGEFPAIGDKKKVLASGGNFMGVYTRDKDQQKVAWELLKFANTPEGIAIWNDSGYVVASKDRLQPLPGQEPAYHQMEAGLTNETIWPGPRGLEALNVFNDWMSKVVRGTVPVEQGMKDGNAAVASLLP